MVGCPAVALVMPTEGAMILASAVCGVTAHGTMLQRLDVWLRQAHQALVLLVQHLPGVLGLAGLSSAPGRLQWPGRKGKDEERNWGCQRSIPLMDQGSQRRWPSCPTQTG